MVIRGQDVANPVLLWVHGGPGMPDYPLTGSYPPGIEDLFTVVWWDQRGTALSFDPAIPRSSMTVDQFVDDTLAVTDHLRARFDQDQIYLLGHSWGSFIAIQAAARSPQRYVAYLAMGQITHQLHSEQLAHAHMVAAYRARGDTAMVRRLHAAAVTETDGTPTNYLRIRDRAMHQLGIGTTHDMRAVITGIFLRSLLFGGYTFTEKVNLWRGRAFSRSFEIWDEIIRVDLTKRVPRLELPVYFFQGAHDYTTSTFLAKEYFRVLDAPVKRFYEFPNSAHSPLLEEPTRGHHLLERIVAETPRAKQAAPRPLRASERSRDEHTQVPTVASRNPRGC
jgi:pimeloyl-ACP methyl ester carboxylesterase